MIRETESNSFRLCVNNLMSQITYENIDIFWAIIMQKIFWLFRQFQPKNREGVRQVLNPFKVLSVSHFITPGVVCEF